MTVSPTLFKGLYGLRDISDGSDIVTQSRKGELFPNGYTIASTLELVQQAQYNHEPSSRLHEIRERHIETFRWANWNAELANIL
jgi:hypothetical protein